MDSLLGEIALKLLEELPQDVEDQTLPIFGTIKKREGRNTPPLREYDFALIECAAGDQEKTRTKFLADRNTTDPIWLDLFVRYFMESDHTSKTCASDDLLFFVRFPHEFNSHLEPVLVKRKTGNALPQLDDLISWKETFLLNLISQMPFDMIVTVCKKPPPGFSPASLPGDSDAPFVNENGLLCIKQVKKEVYASPHKARMDRKSAYTELTYPLLYFYVNDFEHVFDGIQVQEDEYLTVELSTRLTIGDKTKSVMLFQGAVAYAALKDVFLLKNDESQSPFKSVERQFSRLFFARNQVEESVEDERTQYILMRGPQGKGHAQVAVTASPLSHEPEYLTTPQKINDKDSAAQFIKSLQRFTASVDKMWRVEETWDLSALQCRMTFINLTWYSILRDVLKVVRQQS